MADRPDITPEELDQAARIYAECGSFTETARRIGRSEAGVRQALRRHLDTKRGEAHTRALAKAERDARRALERIRAKLEAAADGAAEVKDLAAIAAQIHDNARATTQMRVAHAKLTGDHAADKHALSIAAEVVVLPALESHGSPAAQGAVDAEPGSAD